MSQALENQLSDSPAPKIDLEAGRRAFIKAAGLGAAGAAIFGGLTSEAEAQQTPNLDVPILQFALNLEYLEAEFYLQAAFGRGLADGDTTGTGTLGGVSGGRQVNFANAVVRDYALEIASDEENHVKFLRSALGSKAIARPALDIGAAFTTAARAAGVVGPNGTFDPYADDVSFLLGAYIFEDVGVTAYSGAAPFLKNKTYLAAAAGILAVEAYHAGLIRTFLFAQQSNLANKATTLISALRATLSGKADDQGIAAGQSTLGGGPRTPSNIVPTDANSIAFARTPRQVANIVLGAADASTGLFFPSGPNGNLATLLSL